MKVVFLKSQSQLFTHQTTVAGYRREDGTYVAPHVSTRHVLPAKAPARPAHVEQPSLFNDLPAAAKPEKDTTALPAAAPKPEPEPVKAADPSLTDALKRALFVLESPSMPDFVNAAGGVDAIRAAIKSDDEGEKREALKRALFLFESPLMPAFANGGGAVDVVRKALGKPKAKAPKPDTSAESVKESPKTEHVEAERIDVPAFMPAKSLPKEGDRKTENGVNYVLRNGRWHNADEETAFEAAEDRQDLADTLGKDPHSDEAREALARHVIKNAPKVAPEDDLDSSSPNYRFRDTGYVYGSRKELAADQVRRMARNKERVRVTDVDWEALEENPREAKELITKQNLFGAVDWQDMRDAGAEPGAAFLVSKVYASVSTTPQTDTPDGRRDYSLAITTLRDRLEACRTPAEVLTAIDEIASEREGTFLNPSEQALYEAASSAYKSHYDQVRAIDSGEKALEARYSAAMNEFYAVNNEVEKKQRRGHKVDPEKAALAASLKEAAGVIGKELESYRAENGMKAIVHTTKTDRGVSSRFEYPYKAESEKARTIMRSIQSAAMLCNMAENPLTRAWNSLGDKFRGVIDYRRHKGSETFAKHVATVKAGRVSTWEWAESNSEPRQATGRSTAFQLKIADAVERVGGPEVDVASTEALKAAFNLREVQSGNWVLDDPNAAKFHVEACAGAFADLADLLSVDHAQVSFNGRLAMAFGARGHGAAKAHYEPVHRVINITKLAGAGSLAHEWFHMVDNLVSEATSGLPSDQDMFATSSPGAVADEPISAAFKAVTAAMVEGSNRKTDVLHYTEAEEKWAQHNMMRSSGGVLAQIKNAPNMEAAADAVDAAYGRGAFGTAGKPKSKKLRDQYRKIALIHHGANEERRIEFKTGVGMSNFMLRAAELDKGDVGKYWSAVHELGARAFSSFVEDKLEAAGRKNTYLVSDANNAPYGGEAFPFPEGEERTRINAAMEHLFGLLAAGDVLSKAGALLDEEPLHTVDPS